MGLFNLGDKARQRLLRAVDLGHNPDFVQGKYVPKIDKRPNPQEKLGLAIRCSCGWQSSRAYAKKDGAVIAFLWHIEEVLEAEKAKDRRVG